MMSDLTEANLHAIATPTSTIALSVAPSVSSALPEADNIPDDSTYYGGINFLRLPGYIKPSSELQNRPSWVWKYGYRIQHQQTKQEYFLCRYCHTHQISGGLYQTTTATRGAINHLKKPLVGHGITKEGPIIAAQSMAKKRKLIEMLQASHNIPQALANDIIGSFNIKKFKNAVISWIADSNQPLREVENPAFRVMIGAAS